MVTVTPISEIRAASWPITGTHSGSADYGIAHDLFYNTIPITADKTVATVTLPGSSAIHIFAIAIKH